jgi:hypothetical protein
MTSSRLLTLSLATLLVVAAQTGPVAADDAPQRRDLTPKDATRVAAVTKPAEDFSKAEAFELMQGGAGTSTHGVNQDAFRSFRPTSPLPKSRISSSATRSSASSGSPHPPRPRPPMVSVRFTTHAPARAVT